MVTKYRSTVISRYTGINTLLSDFFSGSWIGHGIRYWFSADDFRESTLRKSFTHTHTHTHTCAPDTELYFVVVTGRWHYAAAKVTADLAENNGNLFTITAVRVLMGINFGPDARIESVGLSFFILLCLFSELEMGIKHKPNRTRTLCSGFLPIQQIRTLANIYF